MKHAIFIIIAVAMVLALGGCAAPTKEVTMERDVDAIVEQADEADEQMDIISDVEEVEADVVGAEQMDDGIEEGSRAAVVVIHDFKFDPHSVTISAGSSVEFVNVDSAPHTASGDTWDTGALAKKQREVISFDEPGTYEYICQFHPGMRGQIVVE